MGADLKLLFFGTSEFAVPTLRALAVSRHTVEAVYTQPDRPAGRGQKLRPSPVKAAAVALDLPVVQPERVRDEQVLDSIRGREPDAIVLAAYGLLIPRTALEIPPLGWLNVHPSLLPRHRGAAPVVASILEGDELTGVSIFRMTPGLDDGPILTQLSLARPWNATAGELTTLLADLGAGLLVMTLDAYAVGRLSPFPQDASLATYAPKLSREDAELDWRRPADELHREILAYNPWPVAFTQVDETRLRVLRALPTAGREGLLPGEVFVDDARYPAVAAGTGALRLVELQLPGGRPIDGKAFLAGHPAFAAARLGSSSSK